MAQQNFFTSQQQQSGLPALPAPSEPAQTAPAYEHFSPAAPTVGNNRAEGHEPFYPEGYTPKIYMYGGKQFMDPGYQAHLGRVATEQDVLDSLADKMYPELKGGTWTSHTTAEGQTVVELVKVSGEKGSATHSKRWRLEQIRFRTDPNYLRLVFLAITFVWMIPVSETVFGTQTVGHVMRRMLRWLAATTLVTTALALMYAVLDTILVLESPQA